MGFDTYLIALSKAPLIFALSHLFGEVYRFLYSVHTNSIFLFFALNYQWTSCLETINNNLKAFNIQGSRFAIDESIILFVKIFF